MSNWGGKRVNAGRRKEPFTSLKDAISNLQGDIPTIIEKLKVLAYGEPVICPKCGESVGINKIDRDAAIYLIDRVLGKPKQVSEVDVTQRIELTADQCATLLLRAKAAEMAIPGEYRLLENGSSKDSSSKEHE